MPNGLDKFKELSAETWNLYSKSDKETGKNETELKKMTELDLKNWCEELKIKNMQYGKEWEYLCGDLGHLKSKFNCERKLNQMNTNNEFNLNYENYVIDPGISDDMVKRKFELCNSIMGNLITTHNLYCQGDKILKSKMRERKKSAKKSKRYDKELEGINKTSNLTDNELDLTKKLEETISLVLKEGYTPKVNELQKEIQSKVKKILDIPNLPSPTIIQNFDHSINEIKKKPGNAVTIIKPLTKCQDALKQKYEDIINNKPVTPTNKKKPTRITFSDTGNNYNNDPKKSEVLNMNNGKKSDIDNLISNIEQKVKELPNLDDFMSGHRINLNGVLKNIYNDTVNYFKSLQILCKPNGTPNLPAAIGSSLENENAPIMIGKDTAVVEPSDMKKIPLGIGKKLSSKDVTTEKSQQALNGILTMHNFRVNAITEVTKKIGALIPKSQEIRRQTQVELPTLGKLTQAQEYLGARMPEVCNSLAELDRACGEGRMDLHSLLTTAPKTTKTDVLMSSEWKKEEMPNAWIKEIEKLEEDLIYVQNFRCDITKKIKEKASIVKKETNIKSKGNETLNDNEERAVKYISNICRTAADGYLNNANSSGLVNKSINIMKKIQDDPIPMHTEFFKRSNELLSQIISFDIPKPLKDSIINPLQKELDYLKKTKEIIASSKTANNLLTDKEFNQSKIPDRWKTSYDNIIEMSNQMENARKLGKKDKLQITQRKAHFVFRNPSIQNFLKNQLRGDCFDDVNKTIKENYESIEEISSLIDKWNNKDSLNDKEKFLQPFLLNYLYIAKNLKGVLDTIEEEDNGYEDEKQDTNAQEIMTSRLIASVERETIRMQEAIDSRNLEKVEKALQGSDGTIQSSVLQDIRMLNENKNAYTTFEENTLENDPERYPSALTALNKFDVPTGYKYLVEYLKAYVRLLIVENNLKQKIKLPQDKLNSLRSRIEKDIKQVEHAYYNRSTRLEGVNTCIFNCRDSFYEVMKTINVIMKHDPKWQGIPNKLLDNIEHAGRLWGRKTGIFVRDKIDEDSYDPGLVARRGIKSLEEMKFDKETEFLRTYAIAYMRLLQRKVELQNERSENAELAEDAFKDKVSKETEKMTQLFKSLKLSEVSDFLSVIETRKDSILKSVESKIKDFGFGKVLEQINHLMMADKSEDRLVSLQDINEIHVPDKWNCLKEYLTSYLKLKLHRFQLEQDSLKNNKSNVTKNAQPTMKSNPKFETKKPSMNPFFKSSFAKTSSQSGNLPVSKPLKPLESNNLPVLDDILTGKKDYPLVNLNYNKYGIKDSNFNQIKKLDTMSPLQPQGLTNQNEINKVTPQINRVNSMPLSDVSMPDDNLDEQHIIYKNLNDEVCLERILDLCKKIKSIKKLDDKAVLIISTFLANLLAWSYYAGGKIRLVPSVRKRFVANETLDKLYNTLLAFLNAAKSKKTIMKLLTYYSNLLDCMKALDVTTLQRKKLSITNADYKKCVTYFGVTFFQHVCQDDQLGVEDINDTEILTKLLESIKTINKNKKNKHNWLVTLFVKKYQEENKQLDAKTSTSETYVKKFEKALASRFNKIADKALKIYKGEKAKNDKIIKK